MKQKTVTFMIGGIGYGLLEIIWRGFTHWSMVLTGGLCLSILTTFFARCKKMSVITKAMCGAGIITAVELVVGIVTNMILKLQVWDYSKLKGNFLGQICPQFTLIWFLLSLPIAYLSKNKRSI